MTTPKLAIYNIFDQNNQIINKYSITFQVAEYSANYLIHKNVLKHQILSKQGTASTKTKGEVRGGGKRRQVCYLCGEEAPHKNHNDEKSKDYHIFRRAKYILFFGGSREIIKVKKQEAVNKFISKNNKYGEEIKVFIGTRTVSEGLDFKRIRQVHILEPWYNLSRQEQVIGRAIRNLSHIDLLPEERNVEIYQYASVFQTNNAKLSLTETVDIAKKIVSEIKEKAKRIQEGEDILKGICLN
jgi:hypothetical protein